MQCQYSKYLERVFMGNAPAIFTVKDAYGVNIAESWIESQIYDLSEFSGSKDKLSTAQIEQVAQVIIAEFGYMKTTELMYFFMLFKSGRFGKFYGAVDGLVITIALRDFCEIRAEKIREFKKRRNEEQRKIEQIEHDKQAISYEEYCKLMDGNND